MRLTTRGRFAIVLALVFLVIAVARASPAASAAFLAVTCALAHALATVRRPVVTVERALTRTRYTEGETVEWRTEVRVLRGRSARATVEDPVSDALAPESPNTVDVDLARGSATTLLSSARANAWGLAKLGPVRVTVRDGFGLVEDPFDVGEGSALRVLPSTEPLGRYAPKGGNPEPALGAYNVSKPGDGSEFFALRNYQAGDSIRRINWKASARSGATMVNQVTRESFARALVFVDLRAKEELGADGITFRVLNGRAAASILAFHAHVRDHLTLVAVGETAERLSLATNPSIEDLVGELSLTRAGGDMPLEAALRAHLRLVKPRSPVYVVTSGTLDPTLASALAVAQGLGARPMIVSPSLPENALDPDSGARILRTREIAFSRARSVGVPVILWPFGESLEVAIRAA